ncbi:hypothetical protein B0T25DRAFT_571100 [Lasiosphaeria hispida]|uniref:Uncharacterized protein n=1 Tax=Lasiosphaeria hispida TaxID=260671 RepID=A0AAJ0HAH3_9PEZI|nr:hypothetical protein B0T25DRAFT_571100 [Lasiosphaeria hispida]
MTDFTGNNSIVIPLSPVEPCHLIGVRCAFYLSYFTCTGCFGLMLPWLYFTLACAGYYYPGCPVPIVVFGTFDMYNVHWQRVLKAGAVFGVVNAPVLLALAACFIIRGLLQHQALSDAIKLSRPSEERRGRQG